MPSEINTFFTGIKKAFLGFYGKLIRVKVFGKEFWKNLHRNCIVVANHVTGVDSIVLQIALRRRLFLLAARKWFKGRFIEFFMTFFCDMIPVARQKGAANLRGIKRSLALLHNRQSLAVYPAGRMSRDASIPQINNGASYLAYKSELPVVAVYVKNLALGPRLGNRPRADDAIEGLGSVARNIFNRKIEVYISQPIFPRKGTDRHKEMARLNAEIQRSFSELQEKASRN